jgi:FKBP-type peptidyl-prolyl cis-trans isomerase
MLGLAGRLGGSLHTARAPVAYNKTTILTFSSRGTHSMGVTRYFLPLILLTVLSTAAFAQGPSAGGLAQKNLAAGKAFMAENRKKEGVIELPNGLQYRVINAGSGPKPKATDTVSVHYRGTLIDGSEFESSARTGKPVSFRLDSVLKGWQEALPNMSQGSKWQIVIPPELGYGEQGAGGRIGPNETMVFDIELVGIGTTKDNRILAGGAQTAAAREAEQKAREREAGSGPTSQPSVDWKNRQYTLDCDMSPPIKVDVRNGHAERRPDKIMTTPEMAISLMLRLLRGHKT